MNIHYELTEEDYINFNLYHIKHSKMGKRSLLLQRIVTPFLYIIVAYLFSMIGNLPFCHCLSLFSS